MLERLKQQLSPYLQARHWYVAYSGGLDSHVLLHALVMLARQDSSIPPVVAVHVNHQIQAVANDWEQHCRQQASALGVACRVFRVDVDKSRNIEENARKARYAVFESLLVDGDCLFFAHHAQDQVETFFYRLFRGAGVKGLQSMRAQRALGAGTLVRPLLPLTRARLQQYACHHGLQYVDDPSNDNLGFDRNYIRHRLLPVAGMRWPAFQTAVQRSIEHLQEAGQLLDDLARLDLQQVVLRNSLQPAVDLQQLQQLSLPRQKNLLRYWLAQQGVVLSAQQTQALFQSVINAGADAQPRLDVGVFSLRRFRSNLFIVTAETGGFADLHWNGRQTCDVPGYGRLALRPEVDVQLVVRSRRGGEKIRPLNSAHTRKLKTLLQELDIPPWQRSALPLVYCHGELIAVGDVICTADAEACLHGSRIVRL